MSPFFIGRIAMKCKYFDCKLMRSRIDEDKGKKERENVINRIEEELCVERGFMYVKEILLSGKKFKISFEFVISAQPFI